MGRSNRPASGNWKLGRSNSPRLSENWEGATDHDLQKLTRALPPLPAARPAGEAGLHEPHEAERVGVLQHGTCSKVELVPEALLLCAVSDHAEDTFYLRPPCS